jgi:hypothetical protein
MDDYELCGNNMRFIEWWLSHHGGDPRAKETISELANLTQGLVQVLVSSQITNVGLATEFRAESAKVLASAANRMASAQTSKAAA